MTLEAARANAARERRVDGDAPPVERPALDDAGELVPGHHRPREPRAADAAVLEPVQVRAAEADGLHAHEALARARLGHGLVGDAHVADPCSRAAAPRSSRLDERSAPAGAAAGA